MIVMDSIDQDELNLLLKMAKFAKIAYASEMEACDFGKREGYASYEFLDHQGAQCHIFGSDEELILAFRGTERGKDGDFWASLNLRKHKLPSNFIGKIHKGYYREYLALHETLLQKFSESSFITEDLLQNRKVYFTGHSLGGALATIAHRDLYPGTGNELITFGSPRVGDKNFARDDIGVPHRRVVNSNDTICYLPPSFIGFAHHGQKIYLNRDSEIEINPTFRRVFMDGVRGLFNGLKDHEMARYVDELEKHVQAS